MPRIPEVHHSPINGTTSVHLNGVKPKVEFVRNDRRCYVEINRSAVLHFACPLEALAFAETLYAAVKTGQPLEPAFNPHKRDRMLEGRM